jgi:hypothetical protein
MIKSQTTKLIPIRVNNDLKGSNHLQHIENLFSRVTSLLLRSLDLEVKEIMNPQNFGIQNLVG